MLRHESEDMDLAEDPEIYRCWDLNLAEDPEIHMDADIRIRRHGSSRGSWDTCGCWGMNPEVWISQRILRYIWMLIYGSGDMDLAEELEIHMNAYLRIRRHGPCKIHMDVETWIRRHGSCKGPWGIKMLRHESETWILQRILRYLWMLIYGSGDMDLAEVPECSWYTHGCWDLNRRHGSGDMDLAEDPEI